MYICMYKPTTNRTEQNRTHRIHIEHAVYEIPKNLGFAGNMLDLRTNTRFKPTKNSKTTTIHFQRQTKTYILRSILSSLDV